MSENTCHNILPLLVDFADGDLPAGQAARVAEHVAACTHCRETLAALRRSLELAGTIWRADESRLTEIQVPACESWVIHLRRHRRQVAVAAGVVLLIAAGSLIWRHTHRPTRHDPLAVPAPTVATVAVLELAVARAGAASGLVAAADYLAEQPGGREIAIQRLQYVVQTYPETEAAAQSRSRLQSVPKGRSSHDQL